MTRTFRVLLVATVVGWFAVGGVSAAPTDVNDIAESYVKLVLEIGLYDGDYVDSYFGPPQWQPSDDQW